MAPARLLLAAMVTALSTACGGAISGGQTASDSDTQGDMMVSDADSASAADAVDTNSVADVEETTPDGLADVASDSVAEDGEAGVCTTIANSPVVTGTSVAESDPLWPVSMAIVPGTYVLESYVDYAGTSGPAGITTTMRRAMHLSATRYEVVRQDDSDPEMRTGGTWVQGPGTYGQIQDCPVVLHGGGGPYTFDGTRVQFGIGGPASHPNFDRVVVMKRVGP